MIRHGHPPFLECSSRGDTRFSAFYARPEALSGKSIEDAYQAMKIFSDGRTGLSWRQAKGHKPVNTQACHMMYRRWWKEWVREQDLLSVLQSAPGLSDIFGQSGRLCQATVLWDLRKILKKF